MPTIVEYFDEYNVDHLAAYKHLCDTGLWPEGFVPEGTEFPTIWQVQIANKLATAWIEAALSGSVWGMPNFED